MKKSSINSVDNSKNQQKMSFKLKLIGGLALVIFLAGTILAGIGNVEVKTISKDLSINYKDGNKQPEPKYSFYDELSKRKTGITKLQSETEKSKTIELTSIDASISTTNSAAKNDKPNNKPNNKSSDNQSNNQAINQADKPANKQDNANLTNNKGNYVVQIGAFSTNADADKMLEAAKQQGFSGRVVLQNDLYMIYIGNYPNQGKATAAQQSLADKGFQTLIKNLDK